MPNARIEPFELKVAQLILDDLKQRLEHTRWADRMSLIGWDYGTDWNYLKELVDYWLNEFDWRKQEAELNRYPQFKVKIDDVAIHFIHVRRKGRTNIPIILTHGWPDSFFRFHKVIPILTNPTTHGDIAFDVVVPSMPGYGFSDRVAMPGMPSPIYGQSS